MTSDSFYLSDLCAFVNLLLKYLPCVEALLCVCICTELESGVQFLEESMSADMNLDLSPMPNHSERCEDGSST